MIVKAGDRLFNSEDEPVIVLFNADELKKVANLNPGNDVLFSYPTHINKEQAWETALAMRDQILAERNRNQIKPPDEPAAQVQPPPAPPVQAAASVPVEKTETVRDDEILDMVGGAKIKKNDEGGLTAVSDDDILAMVGGEKTPTEEEHTKKTSDAVLHATFDVAAADGEKGTP